jgi:Fungal specific transcription factor domain/Fungal Zn(2)-Cys(6) binuclear cluster domain
MQSPSAAVEQKSRKRPRAARACESCRAKKYKCDEDYPCSQCRKLKSNCVYPGAEHLHRDLRATSYVADLERRVQELSAKVEANSTQVAVGSGHSNFKFDDITPPQNHGGPSNAQGSGHLGIGGLLMRDAQSNSRGEQAMPQDTTVVSEQEEAQDSGAEIADVNQHTRSVEFHGNTSSMAFLALIQKQNQDRAGRIPTMEKIGQNRTSLVSTMHNVGFSPDSKAASPALETMNHDESYYFRQAGRFIDGYFENLHCIHPILNKSEFLARCEDLWFGRADRQSRGFIALYYSILSLGALIRVWDESQLDGMNRFQWSRMLFTHARTALGGLRSTNDLETIQCLLFMAKVCQNELSPNLAYMYLGMAVRASLSAGYHRETTSKESASPSETSDAISKTWWGLYSLEVEMSFSLGRPDSVGMENYHNRSMPPIDESEIDIIPCMIPFARITRQVSVATLSKKSLREKIATANEIESEMERWLSTLPETIRPDVSQVQGIKILKDPKWARRQRLVLQIRYHNVKMILYRPFLAYAAQSDQRIPPLLEFTLAKCVDAARNTIEIVHATFCNHIFFRSWWYNTTYILYAASIILSYATQSAPAAEKPELFKLIDMAVEVLEAMDECFVASKAGEMIKQALSNAREQSSTTQQPISVSYDLQQTDPATADWRFNSMLDNQMPYMPVTSMFNFEDPDFNFATDDMQFMFAPC